MLNDTCSCPEQDISESPLHCATVILFYNSFCCWEN